jgi:DNA-binding NtrC family response regulator
MDKNRKHHILIVDDDRQLRIALDKIFTREGYSVTTASNGLEACEIVTQTHFDLVITDIRMPEKNGIEILTSIKKYDPQIPIIVMTAFGEPLSYQNAMEKGAVEYIHKPIKKDAILDLVRNVLMS